MEAGRFWPFRFSLFYCLQLSTNHFILTILVTIPVLTGFHSDRLADPYVVGVSPLGPDPPLRTHLKSQISNFLIAFIIDFNYWLSIVGDQLHESLRSKGSL